MNENTTLKIKNEIRHERDERHLRRCIAGVVAGILVAAGFAFAAQQHFSALQFSAQNVEMQRQRERLRVEQKRLIFEREMASSPEQLETRARKIGLQNVSVEQINRFGENNFQIVDATAAVHKTSETNQKSNPRTETAFIERRKTN